MLCILNPCEYVSIGTYITIFSSENDFETYFATGKILNIQSNNFIQVDILAHVENPALLEKACTNNNSFLKSLIVKPIITSEFIEGGIYNE